MRTKNNKLYVMCGIPFSGKTFLAKEIVRLKGFSRVDLDEIKFEMFGKNVRDEELERKDWDLIYKSIYRRIKLLLKVSKTVVYDTGNFTRQERKLVRDIADQVGVPAYTIFVDISKEDAYQRLLENRVSKKRFDVSNESFWNSAKEMEPPVIDENPVVFRFGQDMSKWIGGLNENQ